MTDIYDWTGWEAETDLENEDDREEVYFLTITKNGEEYALIIHRTVNGAYPLDGEIAIRKVLRAQDMVEALNFFNR